MIVFFFIQKSSIKNLLVHRLRYHKDLLVDELLHDAGVGDDTVGEPEGDLLLGALDGVGTVAEVAADINAEVTADGAGEGGEGVGLTEEDTARLDNTLSGPDHGDLLESVDKG